MKIDNKSLSKLLSMDDKALEEIISKAAKEGGVAIPPVSAEDIAKVRAALNSVGTDPSSINNIMKATTTPPKKR